MIRERHSKQIKDKCWDTAERIRHTSSVETPRGDKRSKTDTKMGPQPVCHLFKELVAECGEYTHGQAQNLKLPSWIFGNGSVLWYFHHSDISGFYFLSNCTAWCVLRGFHENDESLISTMLQLWGEIWKYILSQFTLELPGIIGTENRNREQGWKWLFETQLSLK